MNRTFYSLEYVWILILAIFRQISFCTALFFSSNCPHLTAKNASFKIIFPKKITQTQIPNILLGKCHLIFSY